METRIQLPQLCHKTSTSFDHMIGKSSAANVVTRIPILSHYGTMRFFYNESVIEWKKNIVEHWSSSLPGKNWAAKSLLARPSISFLSSSSKGFFKPINKDFITRCNLKHAMPAMIAAIFMLFGFAYVEATFSVNDSGKICPIFGGLIHMKNNFLCHNAPFVYNRIVLNERKVHAERLSEKDPKGYAIV